MLWNLSEMNRKKWGHWLGARRWEKRWAVGCVEKKNLKSAQLTLAKRGRLEKCLTTLHSYVQCRRPCHAPSRYHKRSDNCLRSLSLSRRRLCQWRFWKSGPEFAILTARKLKTAPWRRESCYACTWVGSRRRLYILIIVNLVLLIYTIIEDGHI